MKFRNKIKILSVCRFKLISVKLPITIIFSWLKLIFFLEFELINFLVKRAQFRGSLVFFKRASSTQLDPIHVGFAPASGIPFTHLTVEMR